MAMLTKPADEMQTYDSLDDAMEFRVAEVGLRDCSRLLHWKRESKLKRKKEKDGEA